MQIFKPKCYFCGDLINEKLYICSLSPEDDRAFFSCNKCVTGILNDPEKWTLKISSKLKDEAQTLSMCKRYINTPKKL